MERGQCIREQTLFTVYCKSGKDDIVVLPCERVCQCGWDWYFKFGLAQKQAFQKFAEYKKFC